MGDGRGVWEGPTGLGMESRERWWDSRALGIIKDGMGDSDGSLLGGKKSIGDTRGE